MGIMCWCWHIIPDFSIMEYFSGKNLHSSPNSINIINEINSYFSSEVIIQSCYEQLRSENKDIKFPEILAELLYKDLLKSVNQRDRDLLCKCLSTQVPSPNLDWNRFLTLIKQLSPVS